LFNQLISPQVNPLGGVYVQFVDSGRRYSWRKVTTTVNNIIVGKLWVDQHGEMEIKGSQAAEAEQAAAEGRPYPAYEPMWFKREKAEGSEEFVHVFKNTYWEAKAAQNFEGCPEIY